jgi:hypothetical protein
MSEQLAFEVTTERRQGLTRDLPAGHDEWRWVANTATLIYGDRDAVLVDTFTTVEQNERLIRWVQNARPRRSRVRRGTADGCLPRS